ncbi:MAG: cytidylate kinase-like family protein [Clostridia bacterium]|nr:cytidylate kinase-like family protein [Clostridia bacterium]
MSTNYIITIGRKCGSGGREIGELIAKKLGIDFYDKEILTHASEISGIRIKHFEKNDEKRPSSLLYSIATNSYNTYNYHSQPITDTIASKVTSAQAEAIRRLAEKSSCVMVGRCADYWLRDLENRVSVFITADEKTCVKNIMERYGKNEKDALEIVRKNDKDRSVYYNSQTDRKWGHSDHYDLCIDTSRISKECAADLIIEYLKDIGLID